MVELTPDTQGGAPVEIQEGYSYSGQEQTNRQGMVVGAPSSNGGGAEASQAKVKMVEKRKKRDIVAELESEWREKYEIASDRLKGLRRGDSYVYHTGFLFNDAHLGERGWEGRPEQQEKASVGEIAKVAWRLYEAGLISLTQRRLGDLNYEYIAAGRIVREPPKRENRYYKSEFVL